MKRATIISAVECKHQRGAFWAEERIRSDARNLEIEFGLPVRVSVERGKWWQPRTAFGTVEFTVTKPEHLKDFERRYERAIKRDRNDESWMHWKIGVKLEVA